MKMKKIIYMTAALTALVSCQEQLIVRQSDGSLRLHLENSPIVEAVTRADGTVIVPVDDFNVYVSSAEAEFSYVYKDMPSVVTVPVGTYTVSAENVSEAVSLSQPDQWGQVRYAGETEAKEVKAAAAPTEYSLTCTMVNTAVSVVFGENIDKHFTEYTVTAYTTDTRRLVYNLANTTAGTPAVGYFSPSTLNYEFTGKFMEEAEPMTIKGATTLQPATHLHLTFKMSGQNGSAGKPTITVDATCTDLTENITVDPTEGGSFETGK